MRHTMPRERTANGRDLSRRKIIQLRGTIAHFSEAFRARKLASRGGGQLISHCGLFIGMLTVCRKYNVQRDLYHEFVTVWSNLTI